MWYLVLIIILFSIFSIVGGVIEIQICNKYGESAGTAFFFGNLYGMLTIAAVLVSLHVVNSELTPKEPEAIDVYRDRVELKIKHVIENGDTISSDTTIVWKEHNM